ncbi:transposase [Nitrosococcus wardiae]|uniref:Transposase n=1 Tax=Nitrosococcus wardiae TaxID=1814290 RepID=A0A4P7C5P3_9GAMM|nr:transposase [Nitrosococcus wardiae]QBQ56182.1 transposase [Nitrosococcus wardiae]
MKQRWLEYWVEVSLCSPEDFIVLEETGAVLNLTPAYGRAPQGQRAYGKKPTTQGERISTIGALSRDGVLPAMCFEGTLNGPVFLYDVEHFLWPHLHEGKVVILDNAAAHRDEEAIERIEQTGAKVVFLPPYPPELNPIEYAWSKLKHVLKKKAARTKEPLYHALSEALTLISPQDCQAYFKHCRLCP